MSFRIFVGWDSRFPEPALVLAHSLTKHSSIPLDIRFLDARHLADCYGFKLPQDKLASTEFSFSRFLCAWLAGYDGLALYLDNDMVCYGDVAELAALPMEGLALRVVQHDYRPTTDVKMHGAIQQAYPRKLWSSLMLMDCSKLRCWTKEAVESGNGARLHRFQDIPDEQLGAVDPAWNEVHDLTPATKLFHWTEFNPWHNPGACAYEASWSEARRRFLADS